MIWLCLSSSPSESTLDVYKRQELTSTKVAISIADVKGNDEVNGADIADLKQVVTQAAEPEKVFDMVEQMPTFPGGQQELMAYLGKNIKYPTIAQENGTQGRVIIQFVVCLLYTSRCV